MEEEINIMKAEIETLKIKNTELEEKLKTYTSNHRHKKYYDNNAEIVIQRAKKYMDKIKETNPEKYQEVLEKKREYYHKIRKPKLEAEKKMKEERRQRIGLVHKSF
jgi:3',5'-cyclic AMP phosphodiesterase CpdA